MAQSHKFKNLAALQEVFPDAPWRGSADGSAAIFDEKAGEYVTVNEGDYVVNIGDRYEVSDSKPENAKAAKPAPAPKAAETDEDDAPETPNATTVEGGVNTGVATATSE